MSTKIAVKHKFLHGQSTHRAKVHNLASGGRTQPPLLWRHQQRLCRLPFVRSAWHTARVLDGVCDVESELHVHGSLGYAGATSVDDGDQGAVQFVHVPLGEQPASTAGLVLHLNEDREEESRSWLRKVIKIKHPFRAAVALPCQPALRCGERAS